LLDPEIGNVDPSQVAYIIIEPIQGEGGYNIPAPGFLEEVNFIAKKYQIPLIVDEVQSGLGRTGKWFAFEHFDIKPDVITLGKTLRMGATVARKEMFSQESGRLGGTWSGTNAIDAAVGFKVIQIIEKDNLLSNATEVGAHLLRGLKKIENRYEQVRNARGLGLMLALTIDGQGQADLLMKEAFKRGLLIFTCGFDAIRMIPPLDTTIREADIALNILNKAMAALF
jgi:4-aminobutyrate aminotransferase